MSSNKHILYNQELTPPASAWDKIAAALDEDILTVRKSTQLADMEIQPPASAWSAIEAQLDADQQANLSQRLYNLEAPPPADVWQHIAAAIHTDDNQTTTPVIPMQAPVSKMSSIFRYAAAAIVIGILAFVVVQVIPSRTAGDVTAEGTSPSESAAVSDVPTSPSTASSIDRGALGASASQLIEVSPSRRTQRARTFNRTSNKIHENQSNALYAYEDHVPDVSNRYIMLMTPDGNLIRMSKKLSNLVCCVSGEEQDEDCKSQIRKWQEQLATSPVSASTGNFMDLLNMVSTLNDSNGL